jgi:hypothetical protein
MFYPKNVPNVERIVRIIIGAVLIGAALFGQFTLGVLPPAVLTASGVFVIITGFIGWCPACAMVGRKLKSK